MLSVAFAAALSGVAAASHDHMHPHVHAGIPSLDHMVPHAFKDHDIKFAPETTFGRVSRALGHWMGFDKGNGFLTVTGFSDDGCMHPVWESGMNVGRCMMAVDSTGAVVGSFRNKVVERKGRYEVQTDTYPGNLGCWSSASMPAPAPEMDKVDTRCHHHKTALDGAGDVGSYQFSWTAPLSTPKIVGFKDEHYRAQIEYDQFMTCNADQLEGMYNLTRYIIQKDAPQTSCYKGPEGSGTSYMTHCAEGEGGPGHPVNVWFNDDHCRDMKPESDMVHFNYCAQTNSAPQQQMYGGGRLYNSPAFGRMHGQASKLICFRGGSDDGMNPADKLTPWNRYKDITVPRDESDGSGGDGDHAPGCYGHDCHCDGDTCMGGVKSQCHDGACFCVGSDCNCDSSMHACNTSAYTSSLPNHCMGPGCGWKPNMGGDVLILGNATLDTSVSDHGEIWCETESNGEYKCKCVGKGCTCHDYGCWCIGEDCSCSGAGVGCSSNPAPYFSTSNSCAGNGCMCSGSCSTMGNMECMSGEECSCYGDSCTD